jgi:hypothetical protein
VGSLIAAALKRPILLFVIVFIIAVDIGVPIKLGLGGIANDFLVFWLAARRDPYAGGLMPFAYPPTTLLWIQPLKLFPFWPAYIAWSVASVAVFYASAKRLWPIPDARLALAGPMVLYALLGGQFSVFVAALVFMAFSSRFRGAWLGLAITLKPQMVFLAPLFLLVDRDWRALVELGATVIAVCVLATFAFGPPIWADWVHSLPALQSAVTTRDIDRVALSPATLYQLPPIPLFVAGLAVALVAAVLARHRSRQLKLTAICATSLLTAPYSLRYDLAVFAPMLAGYLLQGSWRSLIACIPFSGMLGPQSLLIVLLQLVDKDRVPASESEGVPSRAVRHESATKSTV